MKLKKTTYVPSKGFCPIKEIRIRGKKGLVIGNMTFITSEESYRKYRNMLANALHIQHCLFGGVVKEVEYIVIKEKKKKKMFKVL